MSLRKYVMSLLLLANLLSASCFAQGIIIIPTLQVGQNPSGQVIAYVSQQIPACGITSEDSDPTFTIQGTVITVTQRVIAVTCATPPPPDKYYVAALNFGRLFDGTYTINWNFPALTATYTVAGNPGIGAAFSGNWFDSAQSGHGFEIEVLPTDPPQLLVFWFVFAPNGGRAWIGGSGPINGNQAIVQGYQVDGPGALFPPHFDAANVQPQAWGTLTFTFTDCNTGQVSWNSTIPGYGSGTLPITRLTMPAGLSCP
jgi:uncharacterized protein YndB with AHSA1/START domain